MTILTIIIFILGILFLGVCVDDDFEKIKANKGYHTVIMLDITLIVGIFLYWLRNVILVPIVQMYTSEVNMGTLLLAVVLSLISIDYVYAVAYKLPTVPFLAIAFVINCMLAPKVPIVSLAIVFIMGACLYGVLNGKKSQITVLESALVKAMFATSAILTVFNLIGIVLTIVALLIIVALATSVSISVEVYIWKKKSGVIYADYTDAKETEMYPTTIPMIITKGIVSIK